MVLFIIGARYERCAWHSTPLLPLSTIPRQRSVDNFVSNPASEALKEAVSPTQPSVQFRSCCSFQAKSPRKATACGCGLTPRQRQEVRYCRTHSRACKPSTRTVKLPPQGRRRLLFGGRNVCKKTPQIEYTFFAVIQNKKILRFGYGAE